MGDTEGPTRQRALAPEWLAASTLRDTYYRPLVRLAALLTGNADVAEVVACDALATLRSRSPLGPEPSPDQVRYLQRQVIVRSRRTPSSAAGRTRTRRPTRGAQPPELSSATDFARLPVVRALQDLPRRDREAVVLTHYLDLSEQQAALAAGVTLAVFRAHLDQAMHTLHDRLPQK
jgi:DNA-directed RNA polymerase specialized sigma24 family protein